MTVFLAVSLNLSEKVVEIMNQRSTEPQSRRISELSLMSNPRISVSDAGTDIASVSTLL